MHIFIAFNQESKASAVRLLTKRNSSLSWTGSQILPISSDKLNDISEIQILDANGAAKEQLFRESVQELDLSKFSLCAPDDVLQASQHKIKRDEAHAKNVNQAKQLDNQRNSYKDFSRVEHLLNSQFFKSQKKPSLCQSSSSFSKKSTKKDVEDYVGKNKPRLSINDIYQMKQCNNSHNIFGQTQKIAVRERKSLTILQLEKDKKIIEGLIEDLKRSSGKNIKKTPIKEGGSCQQKLIDTIEKISKLQMGSSSKKVESKAKDSGKSSKYEKSNLARNRQSVEIRDFSEFISLGDSYLPLFQNPFNKITSTPATRRQKVQSSNLKNYFDYQTEKKGIKVSSNSKAVDLMPKSANQQKKCISLKMKKTLKQTAAPFCVRIQSQQQSAPFNYARSFTNKQNSTNFWSKQRQKNKNIGQIQQKQERYSIEFRQKR